MRKKYFCQCGKEIAYSTYKYGNGRCLSCANSGRNNPMAGKHPWNYTGKQKICNLCGNIRKKYNSFLCRECYLSNSDLFKPICKKGKNHQSYTTGVYVNRIKKCIECKKPLENIYAKRCHSCTMKRRWDKGTYQITSNTMCEHHLDLNPLNNRKSNKLKLTYKNHNLFHRYVYHYLLEREGIKGIRRYLKWFNKYTKKLEIK